MWLSRIGAQAAEMRASAHRALARSDAETRTRAIARSHGSGLRREATISRQCRRISCRPMAIVEPTRIGCVASNEQQRHAEHVNAAPMLHTK